MALVDVRIVDDRLERYGLPEYATPGSAAVDLRAMITQPLTIGPWEVVRFGTGIAISIGDPRLALKLYPRSGKGSKGLVLANLVGIIDSDYQDQVEVALWNRTDEPWTIEPGEKIAQAALEWVEPIRWRQVSEFSDDTQRIGGFGSTG